VYFEAGSPAKRHRKLRFAALATPLRLRPQLKCLVLSVLCQEGRWEQPQRRRRRVGGVRRSGKNAERHGPLGCRVSGLVEPRRVGNLSSQVRLLPRSRRDGDHRGTFPAGEARRPPSTASSSRYSAWMPTPAKRDFRLPRCANTQESERERIVGRWLLVRDDLDGHVIDVQGHPLPGKTP